jgi:hypothetical protein
MLGRSRHAQNGHTSTSAHSHHITNTNARSKNAKPTTDILVFFSIIFLLSIACLFFSVDSFQYLQKTHTWHSKTERYRLGFLIFSSARTIALSAVYLGFHCARKVFHSMFHTVRCISLPFFFILSSPIISRAPRGITTDLCTRFSSSSLLSSGSSLAYSSTRCGE